MPGEGVIPDIGIERSRVGKGLSSPGRTAPKGRDMADFTDVQATARRIRAAVESLTDPDDLRVVRDYLSELELLAAQQEAEDIRSGAGSLH